MIVRGRGTQSDVPMKSLKSALRNEVLPASHTWQTSLEPKRVHKIPAADCKCTKRGIMRIHANSTNLVEWCRAYQPAEDCKGTEEEKPIAARDVHQRNLMGRRGSYASASRTTVVRFQKLLAIAAISHPSKSFAGFF